MLLLLCGWLVFTAPIEIRVLCTVEITVHVCRSLLVCMDATESYKSYLHVYIRRVFQRRSRREVSVYVNGASKRDIPHYIFCSHRNEVTAANHCLFYLLLSHRTTYEGRDRRGPVETFTAFSTSICRALHCQGSKGGVSIIVSFHISLYVSHVIAPSALRRSKRPV